MMCGKVIRLKRLLHGKYHKACIVPLDHGVTLGPIVGITDYIDTVRQVLEGGADAVILHKGLLKSVSEHYDLLKGKFIMHLSASTRLGPDPSAKVLVSTVEEAVKLGADGVSVHVNLGTSTEAGMIKDLGSVSSACQNWGMPLLAMMYTSNGSENFHQTIHAARIAEELGADIIKIDFPKKTDVLTELVQKIKIPVLIAGGAKLDKPEELLEVIDLALKAGISGVAIGRNIFQYPNPKFITSLISKLVHGEIDLKEAVEELQHLKDVAV